MHLALRRLLSLESGIRVGRGRQGGASLSRTAVGLGSLKRRLVPGAFDGGGRYAPGVWHDAPACRDPYVSGRHNGLVEALESLVMLRGDLAGSVGWLLVELLFGGGSGLRASSATKLPGRVNHGELALEATFEDHLVRLGGRVILAVLLSWPHRARRAGSAEGIDRSLSGSHNDAGWFEGGKVSKEVRWK